jgi:hypothetical protein
VPLPDSILDIGGRISSFAKDGGENPFLVYVYAPSAEFAVRRDLADLRTWLTSKSIASQAVSLAELLDEAVAQRGWLETVIDQERKAKGDERALDEVYDNVSELLRATPTLPDRVLDRINQHTDATAFLVRAGALYPFYRTSALLDELREKVSVPLVLMYPGRLINQYGLRFMDRTDPAYGYRAHIIEREA